MKNIAMNPTIWQPISYSAYMADKKENSNRKTTKDSIIKTANKESRDGKLQSSFMSYFNTFKGFFNKSTVFTNTFYV